jgi:serine/threonine protein kinase
MGEVYRAHDEHLNRDVAVKVLPQGFLADEDARRRFRTGRWRSQSSITRALRHSLTSIVIP